MSLNNLGFPQKSMKFWEHKSNCYSQVFIYFAGSLPIHCMKSIKILVRIFPYSD